MLPWYFRFAAIAIGLGSTLHATPVYYSFSGAVSANTGIAGYTLGQKVSLIVAVDRNKDGYQNYNGATYTNADRPGEDFFQVDYVGGDLAAADAVAFTTLDSHTGHTDAGGSLELTVSNLDLSGNDYFTIQDWSHGLDAWTIGQSGISGTHIMWDANIFWYQTAAMNLTLTNISRSNPLAPKIPDAAPEPSSLALFGLGMMGLAGMARMRKQSRKG